MSRRPAPAPRVRVALLGFALLLGGRASSSHDLWLIPGKYRLDPGEPTRVFINNGDVYPESLTLMGQHRLSEVRLLGPGEPSTVSAFRVDGRSLTFEIQPQEPGVYLLALGTRPRKVRLAPEDFRDYLSEEGQSAVLQAREDLGESQAPATERYAKWAKAVVDVGEPEDDSRRWAEPVGHPLEIVPLAHPNRVPSGGDLPIRVLFRGEPAPAVKVIGARASGAPRTIDLATDERGEAVATALEPGRWFLRALHLARVEDDPETQWESFWSTLTFEVSPGEPKESPRDPIGRSLERSGTANGRPEETYFRRNSSP